MKEFPFITSMIVIRNEERYIKKCFLSLLEQDYPKDRYEVLLVDGISDDNTVKIAKETLDEFYRKTGANLPEVKFLENPKKLLAAGWNLGIKQAKGDYVVRIDAHGFAEHDFISKSVETMFDVKDAVCVGGVIRSSTLTSKGEAIAKVLSSPFGIGNSRFRYSNKAEYVDTVAFGLYDKKIFDEVGYFDETLKRNQDNNMHARIRKSGGKFFLNPDIKTTYYTRDTVKGMMKQGFGNGKWNVVVFRKDKHSLSLRHIIPLLFVLSILFFALGGIFFSPIWWILLAEMVLYLFLGLVFALKKTLKISQVIAMPCLFFLLHFSYGIGSLVGLFKHN